MAAAPFVWPSNGTATFPICFIDEYVTADARVDGGNFKTFLFDSCCIGVIKVDQRATKQHSCSHEQDLHIVALKIDFTRHKPICPV